MSAITPNEQSKYYEIFASLGPINGYITGIQAKDILQNSGLQNRDLERIWDLADIDKDGQLDFEEFCVTMRLIYDILNGIYPSVPEVLPPALIPPSKAHFVTASAALSHGINVISDNRQNYSAMANMAKSSSSSGDDFDWYYSKDDKENYEAIYKSHCDRNGMIKFDNLDDLYTTLGIMRGEARKAFQLVDINNDDEIGKDQTLAFLHVLNQRQQGKVIPTTVPSSLRSTFLRSTIDYNIGSGSYRARAAQMNDAGVSSTSKKAAFADSYLTRLGASSLTSRRDGSQDNYRGTDFSSIKDKDWEEEKLKKQMIEMEDQIRDLEREKDRQAARDVGRTNHSTIKREMEELLEFKQRELLELQRNQELSSMGSDASATIGRRRALDDLQDNVVILRTQVTALENHLVKRKIEMEELQKTIEIESV